MSPGNKTPAMGVLWGVDLDGSQIATNQDRISWLEADALPEAKWKPAEYPMAARDRGAPPQALFKRKRARVAPAAIGEILTRTSYFGRPPIRGCGAAEMHEIRPKHRQIFPRRVTNRARARNVGEGGGALEGGAAVTLGRRSASIRFGEVGDHAPLRSHRSA